MMPKSRHAAEAPRIAVAIADATCAGDVMSTLEARGLDCTALLLDRVLAPRRGSTVAPDIIAFAPDQSPTPELAAQLAPLCRAGAEAGRPMVILHAFPRVTGKAARQRAAALSFLRTYGAVICSEPDTWLETLCLIAAHGLPAGPRLSLVAPEGSWLAASAAALSNEAETLGTRFPTIASSPRGLEPTDIALVDRAALSPSSPTRVGRSLVVPIVGRAELLGNDGRVPLVGLRPAMAAAAAAGRLAERIAAGLGPAPSARDDPKTFAALSPDVARFERQVEKLDTRAGDHEAKVLLASWGIPVTRQAVATTPSAAVAVAKKAGYPVEIKPWGPDQLSEHEGCPVARDLHSAADVRQAMTTVAKAAGLDSGAPVIVRATPPPGREVRAKVVEVGALGWMVILEILGIADPVAAPAPLHAADAAEMVAHLEATRQSDPVPDRAALANILIRASQLAVYHADSIQALYLHRIVVTSPEDTTVVADAQAVLHLPH